MSAILVPRHLRKPTRKGGEREDCVSGFADLYALYDVYVCDNWCGVHYTLRDPANRHAFRGEDCTGRAEYLSDAGGVEVGDKEGKFHGDPGTLDYFTVAFPEYVSFRC